MSKTTQILIIDDETDMCWALENILSLTGYNAYAATTGKEGLELIRQTYPQIRLIFLDMKLPDIDALKLAYYIRQQYSDIIIVAISGYYYCDSNTIQQGITNGLFDGFIGKPFNISEIRTVTKKLGMKNCTENEF